MSTARPPTRTRLLDEAEALFAERGYHGTSLRDITQAAGVEVAMANYHFGPKDALFGAVVTRRAGEHCAAVIGALEAATAAGGAPLPVESVVHAFCAPTFHLAATGGEGWKRYFQLVSRTAVTPSHEPGLRPLHEAYGEVVRRYIAALRESLPGLAEPDLYRGFYLLQAMVSRLLAETGLLDRQSHRRVLGADYDGHLAMLVPFAAAGLRALAAPATGAGSQGAADGARLPKQRRAGARRLPMDSRGGKRT